MSACVLKREEDRKEDSPERMTTENRTTERARTEVRTREPPGPPALRESTRKVKEIKSREDTKKQTTFSLDRPAGQVDI